MLDPLWTHLLGRVDGSMIAINELAETNAQISERNQVPWTAGRNKRTLIVTYTKFHDYMWKLLHENTTTQTFRQVRTQVRDVDIADATPTTLLFSRPYYISTDFDPCGWSQEIF